MASGCLIGVGRLIGGRLIEVRLYDKNCGLLQTYAANDDETMTFIPTYIAHARHFELRIL